MQLLQNKRTVTIRTDLVFIFRSSVISDFLTTWSPTLQDIVSFRFVHATFDFSTTSYSNCHLLPGFRMFLAWSQNMRQLMKNSFSHNLLITVRSSQEMITQRNSFCRVI